MVHTTYDASSKQSKRLRKAAGRYLSKCRKDVDLTQRELASKIGLDYYTFISQLECGAGRVPPNLYAPYADAVGIDRKKFGKEMTKYYDPFTYQILFEEDPYQMTFDDEQLEANGRKNSK